MNELISRAVADFENAQLAFTRFTSPNDAGATGAHQAGWHINKAAWPLFFDSPGVKGKNKEIFIRIRWQNDFDTDSRAVYYGVGTRNEYRLTRFGRGFPFLNDENVGDYIVILKMAPREYKAYVLRTDEEIEEFTAALGISVTDTNRLLTPEQTIPSPPSLSTLIEETALVNPGPIPSGAWIASKAYELLFAANLLKVNVATGDPDSLLVKLIETEYELFKALERNYYGATVIAGFPTVEAFIKAANSILNSRKSRAGKSLENHLSSIFDANLVRYEQQVVTEGYKTADFIFPNGVSYHNAAFIVEDLFFMAAKTTCKDRWRQILNEADRIETKHLMTLQQGISKNQLEEMKSENVILVVPDAYKSSFPKEYRDEVLSLKGFIENVKGRQ